MKKWLKVMVSVLFAVCLCLALVACGGLFGGGSSNNSDSSSSNVNNQPVDSDGTFIYSGATVKAASTSISGDIVIPTERNGSPIDTIPANAFKGCNAITSITVPNEITSIGEGAFNGCSSLRSITLPFVGGQRGNTGSSSRFGYIFGTSFYQGSTEVASGIGSYTHYHIPSGLRTVTITNETVIGYSAFEDCSMLTAINLNDEITQVGEGCFEFCSKITEISLPNVSILPSKLFKGCIALSKFTINSSVDTIGSSAFEGCNALSSVNSDTAGKFIIPDTVTSIGDGAFNGCIQIESITLPFVGSRKGNTGSASYFGYIFGTTYYQGSTLVRHSGITGPRNYIPSTLRSVTITNETIVGNYAFRNCTMLQSITINSGAQNNVGEDAFEGTVKPTWN